MFPPNQAELQQLDPDAWQADAAIDAPEREQDPAPG